MQLLVLEGPAARQAFEVTQATTLIGRAPDCDILVFDAQVSRHHAQIVRQGDDFVVEGLQQANPVIINDRILTGRRRLSDRDLIVVGGVVFEVDLPPPPKPAQSMPDTGRATQTVRTREGRLSASTGTATTAPVAAPVQPPPPASVQQPAPAARRAPRAPALPPTPPREALRTIASRLGAAGQRLQSRTAPQTTSYAVTRSDGTDLDAIVAEHERLGGDDELARLAGVLSARLSNQTDIRALYRLGAEAAVLLAWSKLATRSMEEAVHLAKALGA